MQYTLVRMKRKTLAINVKKGIVTVKAPIKASLTSIENFVARKEKWIRKKLWEDSRRMAAFSDVLANESFLYLGKKLKSIPYRKSKFCLQDGILYIPSKFYIDGTLATSNVFVGTLKKFYKQLARAFLATRLEELAKESGLQYTDFQITSAKTKWGSCDLNNRILLNWHLVLLRTELIDYVIIHELIHTLEHNHSRAFWNKVLQFYPHYKGAVQCLKDVSILIDLWE